MKRLRLYTIVISAFFFVLFTKGQNKNSFEYARQIISSKSELSKEISNHPICFVPNMGLFVAHGNRLLSIDNNYERSEITLNEDIKIDDIISTGNDLIIKNKMTIFSLKDQCKPIATFNTPSFCIFSSLDGNMFITSQKDSVYQLSFFDVTKKMIKPLSNFDEHIIYVSGDTLQCNVVTLTKIYKFKGNKGRKLLEYTEPIITATMTDNGLLFATKNQLILLNAANRIKILAEFGCNRLIADSAAFYAEYKDGSIIWYYFRKRE